MSEFCDSARTEFPAELQLLILRKIGLTESTEFLRIVRIICKLRVQNFYFLAHNSGNDNNHCANLYISVGILFVISRYLSLLWHYPGLATGLGLGLVLV